MPYAHSFTDVTPPARFDSVPWTHVRIEEASSTAGPWTQIDEQAIAVDPSPDTPNPVNVTTNDATLESGYFRFRFRDASLVLSPYSAAILSPGSTTVTTYTTASELRDELELDVTALPDADAVKLIVDAEDLVDGMLGARRVDETTGRKVVQADVEAWQWLKLTRATVKVAAGLHRNPAALTAQQWERIKGPDYEFEGRYGSTLAGVITDQVVALLDSSELRRLTTTIGPSRDRPPWYSFAYNTEDEEW